MLLRLFLLFTVVPLLELYFLIKIGGSIGALNTVLILVATALLGAILIRWEGMRTLKDITETFREGRVPAEQMVDGLFILLAGILLITPGVVTDVAALLLLTPFTRRVLKRRLRNRLERSVASGRTRLHFHGGGWGHS
ncbi:MAG: FxsA family protein [Candidatus Binatia bacterium]